MDKATPLAHMSGQDLDRELRRILMAATRETRLRDMMAIVRLGFQTNTAANLVIDILNAKDRGDFPKEQP